MKAGPTKKPPKGGGWSRVSHPSAQEPVKTEVVAVGEPTVVATQAAVKAIKQSSEQSSCPNESIGRKADEVVGTGEAVKAGAAIERREYCAPDHPSDNGPHIVHTHTAMATHPAT